MVGDATIEGASVYEIALPHGEVGCFETKT